MTEDRLLEILGSATGFVSGEQISEKLGISRTAVWKAVNRLRDRGCRIESATNKGYRLLGDDEIAPAVGAPNPCGTDLIGRNIRYFPQCTSTNDKAREGGMRSDAEGTVYITDHQTDGRGRMGRGWHGDSGKSVILSILLRPDVPPSQIMPVSLLAGLAACDALEETCGLACGLKWPNDIIADSKKVGGILIETSTAGESVQHIVLGIGINCNSTSFPDDLADRAASVLLLTGVPVSRRSLICSLLRHFEHYYLEWLAQFGETALQGGGAEFSYLAEYRRRCLNIGREVDIHTHGGILRAVAADITPDGRLLVRLPDGGVTAVLSGEVSLRGVAGYA